MPGFVGTRIELVLAGAIASVNPSFLASYIDVDNTAKTLVPGSALGVTNGSTAVTVYTNTTGTTVRVLKFLSVYNADSAAVTLTVQYNVSTVITKVLTVTLQPGEQLRYDDRGGFRVLNTLMAPKIGVVSRLIGKPDFLRPIVDAKDLTTALTPSGTNTGLITYLGVCPRVSSSIDVLFRVSTAGVTPGANASEVGIFRGVPYAGNGNSVITATNTLNLELLGFVSLASIVTSLGIKKVNIPLTIAAQPGDDLYVCIHTQFTTKVQFRGGLADDLQSSLYGNSNFLSIAGGTFVGYSGRNWQFAVAANTIVVPWIAGFVN